MKLTKSTNFSNEKEIFKSKEDIRVQIERRYSSSNRKKIFKFESKEDIRIRIERRYSNQTGTEIRQSKL